MRGVVLCVCVCVLRGGLVCLSPSVSFFFFPSGLVAAADLKDEEWHSFTCPMRWGTQGMWHDTDRRHVNASDVSSDGRLVAMVDESGELAVYKHPCVDSGSRPVGVDAHACHVTCARFSCDGKYLFTVGGRDRTMMQWKVITMS